MKTAKTSCMRLELDIVGEVSFACPHIRGAPRTAGDRFSEPRADRSRGFSFPGREGEMVWRIAVLMSMVGWVALVVGLSVVGPR